MWLPNTVCDSNVLMVSIISIGQKKMLWDREPLGCLMEKKSSSQSHTTYESAFVLLNNLTYAAYLITLDSQMHRRDDWFPYAGLF